MPQNTTYGIADSWTLLTDANVSAVTFQNTGIYPVWVATTNGTTPPAAGAERLLYNAGQGERNVLLSDLTPGISGANRIWARAFNQNGGRVFVSHV